MDIFNILIQKINRDNKNNYCNDHAMERAKIIENSLFDNCKNNLNWVEIYNEITVDTFIDRIEMKTTKCQVRIPN